jgi:hypothetical protein
LENENVTVSELVQSIAEHCQQNLAERHVLAISDSSEINLQSHIGRLKSKDLGVVGNNTDVGFYIHPTLIVDSENGFPLGLSTIQLWSRDIDHQDKYERNYKKLPIEQHDVMSIEQALQVIEWYKWRWRIEQLFAAIKKAGLNLEAS